MPPSRFFEWIPVAALIVLGIIALPRAARLRARGVTVVSADRQRTISQMMADTAIFFAMLIWVFGVFWYAFAPSSYTLPPLLDRIVFRNLFSEVLGAVLTALSVYLYGAAIWHLGDSWRMGIDRSTPGPLVTDGIYRWTRHPIYLSFDLLFTGTFLIHGRAIFLVLTVIWLPLMHHMMLREERFLMQLYNGAYRDYCKRVGRYFR